MYVFSISTSKYAICFKRNAQTNTIEPDSKIGFIKFIRETFNCDLKAAKEFCDLMLQEMSTLHPNETYLRTQITDAVANINNADHLQNILNYINNSPIGTFDYDGNYIPRNIL